MLERLAGRLPDARVASLAALRDPGTGELLDRALVLTFPGPASATGENLVEYQCHGGRAIIDRLLAVIVAQPGCRAAEPGEFTRRALGNGRIDLTEAEGLADLLEAETESQRRAALLVAEGGLSAQVETWRHRLVQLSAQAEAAIDYVDDEDETAQDAAQLANDAGILAGEIAAWLERPRAERLKDGVRVVLAGPPNAGKSSLINALVGFDRAIVTDIAGTTRDSIDVPVSVGGIPFVLVDTAGLRDTTDVIEKAGIDRSRSEVRNADIILWMGDPTASPDDPRVLRIHPQCDRPNRRVVPVGSLGVSATEGTNLSQLWELLVTKARALLPAEGEIALNRRQAAALTDVVRALESASSSDIVVTAHALRASADSLGRLTGRIGVEDMLDELFGRFCLGK